MKRLWNPIRAITRIIASIRCRHRFIKISFIQTEDRFERYSMREYRCAHCKKIKWVDGRYDPYA